MTKKLTATQRTLITEGAALAAQIDALKAQLDAVKTKLDTALKGAEGKFEVVAEDGATLTYSVKTSQSVVLDTAAVKGFLTPAQIAEASRPRSSTRREFKTKAPVASLARAA